MQQPTFLALLVTEITSLAHSTMQITYWILLIVYKALNGLASQHISDMLTDYNRECLLLLRSCYLDHDACWLKVHHNGDHGEKQNQNGPVLPCRSLNTVRFWVWVGCFWLFITVWYILCMFEVLLYFTLFRFKINLSLFKIAAHWTDSGWGGCCLLVSFTHITNGS